MRSTCWLWLLVACQLVCLTFLALRTTPTASGRRTEHKSPSPTVPVATGASARLRRVVVTAANTLYEAAAFNLAASALFWGAESVLIYDLGGLATGEMRKWARVCEPRIEVVPGKWSPPWETDLNQFGWKGLVIADAVDRSGAAFYVDAGSEVRAPLAPLFALLAREGHVFFKGQDSSARKATSKLAASALNFSIDILRGHSSFWAGGQAYVRGSDAYHRVLVPLAEASMRRAAIAPVGTSTNNHRQDQSAMTLFAVAGNFTKHYTRLLASTYAYKLISRDPRVASPRTIWSSRRTGAGAYASMLAHECTAAVPPGAIDGTAWASTGRRPYNGQYEPPDGDPATALRASEAGYVASWSR